jgi:hypothetical protein
MRVKIFEDSFPVFDTPAGAENNINTWLAANPGVIVRGVQISTGNFVKGDTTYLSLITLVTYQEEDAEKRG